MEFEWDPKKAVANARKHTITFKEAASVFGDPDHSMNENRWITFGMSLQKGLLVVSHTERGDKTRIVSARLMDRKEKKIYEEG
jgi:uncharacterized DUF497 family protein